MDIMGVKLTMMSNRGMKVWPGGAPETFCTNQYRCRFQEAAGRAVTLSDPAAVRPTFTAPMVSSTLRFLLVVSDGRGGSAGDEVRVEVLGRCEAFARGGGFVFNTVHNIQIGTPTANIVAMFHALGEFNGRR